MSTTPTFQTTLSLLLVFLNLFLTVHYLRLLYSPSNLHSNDINYTYIGPQHPSTLLLELPPTLLTLTPTKHYRISTPVAPEEWESSLPSSGGYFRLGEDRRTFMLSMYHSMHCLEMMRGLLGGDMHMDGDGEERGDNHWDHCWGYLREVLLCRSDLALEPCLNVETLEKREKSRKERVMERLQEGKGALDQTHEDENDEEYVETPIYSRVCRDWTKVSEYNELNYLEFHQYRAQKEILEDEL